MVKIAYQMQERAPDRQQLSSQPWHTRSARQESTYTSLTIVQLERVPQSQSPST